MRRRPVGPLVCLEHAGWQSEPVRARHRTYQPSRAGAEGIPLIRVQLTVPPRESRSQPSYNSVGAYSYVVHGPEIVRSMEDSDLVDRAVTALEGAVGQNVSFSYSPPEHRGGGADGKLVVAFGGATFDFDVLVIPKLNAARASKLTKRGVPGAVVISHRVTPAIGDILHSGGVWYLDLGGNAHIEAPPLLVHVSGMEGPPPKDTVRAFTGEGLKVIFLLLLDPALTSAPYRRLAELSGVSHGVVQYTMDDLIRLKYVAKLSRTERRLSNAGALLDRWAAGYTEVLRPKLTEGTFAFPPGMRRERVVEWQSSDLVPDLERWGGEPAAALDTGYLRPARLTIYARTSLSWLMKRLHVAPSEEGELTVVRPFWTTESEKELPQAFGGWTVPRVVTYADLLSTGDPRNAEVAAMLREEIVSGLPRV